MGMDMPTCLSHRVPNDSQAVLEDVVARFIEDIVEAVHPLRILLFGSQARGEAGAESDIDLLVVMPEGAPLRQIARRLYREIPRNGFSLDVLVATPSLLEKHRNHPGLIYHTILQEGYEVYAA